MDGLLNLLVLVGPVSLVVALFVLAMLSQRLSSALPHRTRYRWLLVAFGLSNVAVGIRLLRLTGSDNGLLTYTILTSIALTIAVPVAWGYWGWLLGEDQRVGKSGHNRDVQ